MNRAYELSRAGDRDIDRIFPSWNPFAIRATFGDKVKMYDDLGDLLFSGKPAIDKAGRMTMGEMDPTMMKHIRSKFMNMEGAKSEYVDNIFHNMGMMRNKWSNMASLIKSNLPIEAQPVFENIMKDQFRGWLSRTYKVFENKSLIPFFNWKPPSQAV